MAVTDAYATFTQYHAVIKKDDTSQDAQITLDLTAMSRYLDWKLDRHATGFNIDAVAVARVYYPKGYMMGDPEAENPWKSVERGRAILVDEIAATPTSIIIDQNRTGVFTGYTPLAATDYELRPLNANRGPEPKPWNQIYLPSWSTVLGFAPGCPVQVTAQFGWPAVPAAITSATIQLTAILRLESPRATTRVPDGIDAVVGTSQAGQQIVNELLHAYRRTRLYA